MFRSRRGRPSLIQTAARTAVISGTATAVSGKVAARQAAGAAQAQPLSQPPAPAAGGGLSDEAIARLQQLAELHKAGVLTAEEFQTQKARILA